MHWRGIKNYFRGIDKANKLIKFETVYTTPEVSTVHKYCGYLHTFNSKEEHFIPISYCKVLPYQMIKKRIRRAFWLNDGNKYTTFDVLILIMQMIILKI